MQFLFSLMLRVGMLGMWGRNNSPSSLLLMP